MNNARKVHNNPFETMPSKPFEEVDQRVNVSEETNTFVKTSIILNNDPRSNKQLNKRKNSTVIFSKKNSLNPAEIQEKIEDFVSSFLHPYITGEITKENEPKNRKPMMELLLEELSDVESVTTNEIEKMAFNAYIKKAALGLYVNRGINKRAKDIRCYCKVLWLRCKGPFASRMNDCDIRPASQKFNRLIDALKESLPKDFPDKKLEGLPDKKLKDLQDLKGFLDTKMKDLRDLQDLEDKKLKGFLDTKMKGLQDLRDLQDKKLKGFVGKKLKDLQDLRDLEDKILKGFLAQLCPW